MNKNSGEQEKESIIRVRVGYKNPSLEITVCHHSASLVMPNGDPQDGFFYPTLTVMIDSYNMTQLYVLLRHTWLFIHLQISNSSIFTIQPNTWQDL